MDLCFLSIPLTVIFLILLIGVIVVRIKYLTTHAVGAFIFRHFIPIIVGLVVVLILCAYWTYTCSGSTETCPESFEDTIKRINKTLPRTIGKGGGSLILLPSYYDKTSPWFDDETFELIQSFLNTWRMLKAMKQAKKVAAEIARKMGNEKGAKELEGEDDEDAPKSVEEMVEGIENHYFAATALHEEDREEKEKFEKKVRESIAQSKKDGVIGNDTEVELEIGPDFTSAEKIKKFYQDCAPEPDIKESCQTEINRINQMIKEVEKVSLKTYKESEEAKVITEGMTDEVVKQAKENLAKNGNYLGQQMANFNKRLPLHYNEKDFLDVEDYEKLKKTILGQDKELKKKHFVAISSFLSNIERGDSLDTTKTKFGVEGDVNTGPDLNTYEKMKEYYKKCAE